MHTTHGCGRRKLLHDLPISCLPPRLPCPVLPLLFPPTCAAATADASLCFLAMASR